MEKTKCISLAFTTLAALSSAACSDESGGGPPTDVTMGGSSSQTQGGSGGSGTSGSSGSGGGGTGFTLLGACGQRGEAPVNATTFGEGFEEYYILGDEGFEPEVCIVRFVAKGVGGDVPPGCEDCLWTHRVGFEMPSVVLDTDGACANSKLAMTTERMNEIVASTATYGFVSEFSGHNSVLMKYNDATQIWDQYGNATWDPMTDTFTFNNRGGTCGYGG